MQVQQKIISLERQFASTKEEFFDLGENGGQTQTETEHLQGDFEKDVQRFGNPQLQTILRKNQDVFGPLRSPGSGCKLVKMDIELSD